MSLVAILGLWLVPMLPPVMPSPPVLQQGKKRLMLPDKWQAPAARVFASPMGAFGFKFFPTDDGKGEGVLFTIDGTGAETEVWRKKLVCTPVEVYVSELGHVATVDMWGAKGRTHAVVIYDRTGKTVTDLAFNQIFPNESPTTNPFIIETQSSIHWTINADFDFYDAKSVRRFSTADIAVAPVTESGLSLRVRTGWGETIFFDPDSGRLVKRIKPAHQ